MYIIELFFKIKEDLKLKKYRKQKLQKQNSNEIEEEKCNHLFVPIDSTKQILACSKCGEIYKLKKGEVNPFE